MIAFFQNQNQNFNSSLLNGLFLVFLVVFGFVNPMAVVFAYVFETVSIGVIHVIKLFYVIKYNEPESDTTRAANYATIPFFMFHYGMFVAIQTIFIYVAFAANDDRFSTSLSFSNLKTIFQLEGFYLVAAIIVVSQLANLYFSFLKNKKYLNQKLKYFFMKPYPRIFIQQFLAIIPFFFLFFTSVVGIIAAVVLIILRSILDLTIAYVSGSETQFDNLVHFLAKDKDPEDVPEMKEALKVMLED